MKSGLYGVRIPEISAGPNNLQHHTTRLIAGFFTPNARQVRAFSLVNQLKLTERQVALRKAFRETLLRNWRSTGKTMMFSMSIDVGEQFGITQYEAKQELAVLPSIRMFGDKTPLKAWLAKHYPAVSNAMFDGKTDEQALAIWSKSKYQLANQSTRKRSRDDMKVMADTHKNTRANRAYAELKKSMPDRWARTSWNVVK